MQVVQVVQVEQFVQVLQVVQVVQVVQVFVFGVLRVSLTKKVSDREIIVSFVSFWSLIYSLSRSLRV